MDDLQVLLMYSLESLPKSYNFSIAKLRSSQKAHNIYRENCFQSNRIMRMQQLFLAYLAMMALMLTVSAELPWQ
jgi:hypothetical protein